jgi:hypothetical protein
MADEDSKKLTRDTAVASIVEALRDETFAIEGTPTVTVKKADGTFRTKPMMPGSEFFLTGGYIGARDKLYLIFTPVDAQEYIHIESETKKLDTIFPDFGFRLGAQFEIGEEAAHKVVNEIIALAGTRLKKEALEKAAVEQAEKKASYEDNPLFGAF